MEGRENCQRATYSQPSHRSKDVSMKVGQQNVRVNRPHPVIICNKFMNGVDGHDQLRMQYPGTQFSKKYWKYELAFLLSCTTVNAFIVYKETSKRVHGRKMYTHLDFRVELAGQLIRGLRGSKMKAQPSFEGPAAPENQQAHVSEHMGVTKGKRCKAHLWKEQKGNCLWLQGVRSCSPMQGMPCHFPFPTAKSTLFPQWKQSRWYHRIWGWSRPHSGSLAWLYQAASVHKMFFTLHVQWMKSCE